eukprot:g5697.t1
MAVRLASMLGLAFSDDCKEALRESADPAQDLKPGSASFFFTSTDIQALDARVKHMTVVDSAAGKLLMMEKRNYIGEATIVPTRLAAAAKRRFEAVLACTPADEDARARVDELASLTSLKDRLDGLIRFSASTRESTVLVQMRDEKDMWEKDGVFVDLSGIVSGMEMVDFRWWVNMLKLLLEETKFRNVTHIQVAEDAGRSFSWQGQFDFDESKGMFPVDLLRGRIIGAGGLRTKESISNEVTNPLQDNFVKLRLESSTLRRSESDDGGTRYSWSDDRDVIQIDTLEVARGSGLLYALISICPLRLQARRIKNIAGMPEADLETAIMCLGEVWSFASSVDFSHGLFDGNKGTGASKFTGDITTVIWPKDLQALWLMNTDVFGSITEVSWPAALVALNLADTKIEGDISDIKWPPTLEALVLSSCKMEQVT